MAGLEQGDIFGSVGVSTQGLLGGLDIVTTIVVYVFIGLLVGAILFGCLYLLSFKHHVRVYQKTSGGWTILDTKARQFKTKDGVVKWRLLKWLKDSHAAPDNEMLSITVKGKVAAECIRQMNGHLQWVKRDLTGVSPVVLTGEELTMTVNEVRRAQEFKKKKLSDIILQVFPFIVLAMILIIFMVFFNDVVQPSAELADSLKASSEQLALASNRLADAYAQAYPELVVSNSSVELKAGDVFVPN